MYLDDIFIYTNHDKNGHIAAVWWVIEEVFAIYQTQELLILL